MTAGQYPLVAFYDANGKPIKLAEATSIVVGSISATNYQNLPAVGGGIAVSAALPGEIYIRDYTTSNPAGIPYPEGDASGYLSVKFEDGDPVYAWENPPGASYSQNPTGTPEQAGVWSQNVLNSIYVNVAGDTMTGPLTVPEVNTGFIDFDLTATPTPTEGRVAWNDTYKTLEIDGPNQTSIYVGQEVVLRVINNTGSELTKGTVVYINGVDNTGIPTVAKATATSENQTHRGMGVLKQTLGATGSTQRGFMVVTGKITGLNIGAIEPGSVVYLSETAGEFTTTYAAAPNHPEVIGYVGASGNNGSLIVAVQHGYEMQELHNVDRTEPTTQGSILYWNNAASKYQLGDHGNLAGLGDNDHPQYVLNSVATTSNEVLIGTGVGTVGKVNAPSVNGSFLSYNGTSLVWSDHLGQADPHTQYLRESVATQANQVLYTTAASSVSATSAATTANTYLRYTGSNSFDFVNPITGHVAESDPHTQYLLETGTNAGQIVYRKADGSSSSINVGAGDNGKYLTYNSTTSSYSWGTPTAATPEISLENLTNVTDEFFELNDGDVLSYNLSKSEWENRPANAVFIGDFIVPPEAGSIITLASSLSVIEVSNYNISSVSGHISNNSIHWQLSTLNSNYVNTSGDSMTGGLTAPSLSSTTVSAVSASVGIISATTYQNLPSNQKIIAITILNPSSITYYPLFYAKYISEILEINSVIVNGTSVSWSVWSTADVSDPTTGTAIYDSKVTDSLTTGNTETGASVSEGWLVLQIVGYSGAVSQLQLTFITN